MSTLNNGQLRKMLYVVFILLVFSGIDRAEALPPSPALADTVLNGAISQQAMEFTVSSVVNIDVGDILIIDPGKGNEERIRVGGITGSTVSLPAAARPLKYAHGAGARVAEADTVGLVNGVPNLPPNSNRDHNPGDPSNFQGQMDSKFPNLPLTGGPHGTFTTNTNACGRCHQMHVAKSEGLSRFNTASAQNPTYGVCTYCHSFNGQSTYDVKNGMIWDTFNGYRYATNGGGFERMLVVEGPPQIATVVKVSSKHRVDEEQLKIPNGAGGFNYQDVKFNAPGGYPGPVPNMALKCTSCHQPHGTKHSRLLVTGIKTESVDGNPNDSSDDITIQTTSGSSRRVTIKVNNPFGDEKTEYNEEVRTFCLSCHIDYEALDTGLRGIYTYYSRHYTHESPSGGLNGYPELGFGYNSVNFRLPITTIRDNGSTTTGPGTIGVMVCLTCHYAHGTFVQMEGIKTYDTLKLNPSAYLNTPGGFETPKNLRLDNRGVCQNCHNRMRSLVKPVLVNVLDPAQPGTVQYGKNGSLLSQKYLSATPNTITIRFNQYMLRPKNNPLTYPGSVENLGHYKVTGATAVNVISAVLQPDGRTVILTLDRDLNPGENVNLTFQNVSGNHLMDSNFNQLNPGDSQNVVSFTK